MLFLCLCYVWLVEGREKIKIEWVKEEIKKENMKRKEIVGIVMVLVCRLSFIRWEDDNEERNELRGEGVYESWWGGRGDCEGWRVENMGVGMEFVDSGKGKVNWEG